MPVDNQLYDRPEDIWWDDASPLSGLRTSVNPGRLAYLGRVIRRHRLPAAGESALDVGCGGGLMAEEVARIGFRVTGVDPSGPSLATARAHAAASGLQIGYRQASGESLPFADATFDLVYCCDVLEHVDDLDRVVSEATRTLKPGGVYLYDTINRTLPSWLVMIKLFQEWRPTRFMPPALHDWRHFIRPAELVAVMERHGLRNLDLVGLKPAASPAAMLGLLRRLRRGEITPAEMGRRSPMVITRDLSILYAGHAVKRSR